MDNLSALFFAQVAASSDFLAVLYSIKQEAALSYYFDLSAVQDSFRFRALHRARAIAFSIIDDQGELNKAQLERIVLELQHAGYLFYPEAFNDGVITEHMLGFLTRLLHEPSLFAAIRRFQKPLCHKEAELLVFNTLGQYQKGESSATHIRRAVVCACLTPLRQSIGSCFASAPAILIQREQVHCFIDDLYQLLTTGKLKRTFAGNEYSVPLSPHIGTGDLRKNLLALDPRAMVWFSPGLIAACEVIGCIPSHLPFDQKALLLKECISQCNPKKTIEEFIHHRLLIQMEMSDEELHRKTAEFRLQIKMMHLDPRALRATAAREEFYSKKKEAIAAFSGYCDNALLKAWEFSLASFVDVKREFSRWNLYHSLGFSAEEPGGIGELIFKRIDQKLQTLNAQIAHLQQECQAALDAARATEGLLRNAGSETEARRLQAEYHSRAYHMRSCLDMRDELYSEGAHYSTFFTFLLTQYDKLFRDSFQEIYDPDIVDPHAHAHDDSLAGFRLVYTHGRSDPSQWTLIYDADGYTNALLDFFSMAESLIASEVQWENGKKEVVEITSLIMLHVRSEPFLQSATQRLIQAPSSLLTAGKAKQPWAYISGGTMATLLQTYFCRENESSKEEKWVESESELLIFLLDTLKHLSPRTTDPFLQYANKGMLITSPTHAFILLPGQTRFREGWQEEGFTYTWVRDSVFLPSQQFYADMQLPPTQQLFLLEEFLQELPLSLKGALHQAFPIDTIPVSAMTWRNRMLDALNACADAAHPSQKRALADGIDAFLFQSLPVVPASDWKPFVRRLLSDLYDEQCKESLFFFSDIPCAYMTARKIKERAKACYIHSRRKLFSSLDLHSHIAQHARLIGLAGPTAMICADTNWPNHYFGFVVNPGTGRLELWRLDRTASQGTPMSDWKQWLDGTQHLPWTIHTNPAEYLHLSKS